MPQKLNKAGKMQDYIPKGNGDASGEYGTSNGTNKNFTTSDKKETKANVITENKSVAVENKGKKEKEKPFDIDTLDVSLRKKVESGEITLKDASKELAKAGWYNFIPSEEETKKALGIKDYKANVIDDDLSGKKENKMGKLIPSSELKMVDLSGKRFKDDDGKWYEVKNGGYGIEHNGRLVSTNSKSSGGSNMPQIYDKKLTQDIINQGLVEFETAYIDEGYDAEQHKRWVESGYEATWDTKPKKNNYDGKIHLQGIGNVDAKKAENLKVGDITMWNFGYTETIEKIEPTKSGNMLVITIKSSDSGKTYERRMKKDRLVGITDKERK